MEIAIFYASSTGNTSAIAEIIAEKLGCDNIFDISDGNLNKIAEYNNIILGIPTWGDGELSDDWEDNFEEFKNIDFSSKNVALYGLGDQDGYPDTFLDGMGIIYEELKNSNANILEGSDIDDSYFYEESRAVVDNKFVGLALDEDNQSELSEDRLENWILKIKKEFV